MRIEYDKTANAMYMYFSKGKILHTKELTKNMLVDVGARGKIIGLEILDAASILNLKKRETSKIQIPVAVTA